MSDVFTYDNKTKPFGNVASADYASVSIGKKNSLVQSCDVNYGQQIEEVTQVGSTEIFWLPGKPQGKITIGSLVGESGFFSDWKGPCGILTDSNINLGGGKCTFAATGGLEFSGAIVESLTANLSAGRQTISQGATIRIASMSTT